MSKLRQWLEPLMGNIHDEAWQRNPEVAVPVRARYVETGHGQKRYYTLGTCTLEYQEVYQEEHREEIRVEYQVPGQSHPDDPYSE